MAPRVQWEEGAPADDLPRYRSAEGVSMPHARLALALATISPRLFTGSRLHHAALGAMAEEDFDTARGLFACAAEHYRREVAVEALARLRVHELIGRVRSQEEPGRETEMCLEVERRLTLLDRIESLEAPFEMRPARTLLANWYAPATDEDDPDVSHFPPADLLRAA